MLDLIHDLKGVLKEIYAARQIMNHDHVLKSEPDSTVTYKHIKVLRLFNENPVLIKFKSK